MSLLVTTTTTESSSQVATIKLCQGALDEAAVPHGGRIPTSPLNKYKEVMFENIAMLWMGTGEIYNHVTTGDHNHH